MNISPRLKSSARSTWIVVFAGVLTLSAVAADSVRLQVDYQNALATNLPPPVGQPGSIALFGGYIATSPPAVGSVCLQEASFGQMLAQDQPFPNFAVTVVEQALSVLYPPPGASRDRLQHGPFPEGRPWAFRYKRLLYDSDAVVSEFAGEWFGAAERAQADAALALLHGGLFYAPYDRNLRHAYLDLFYDIGVAELQEVKNDLNRLAMYRLDPDSLPDGKSSITAEIETYSNVVFRLEHALAGYSQLLSDQNGFDVRTMDADAAPNTPLGYYIFVREQPNRDQFAAQFTGASGEVLTVPDLNPETGQPLPPGKETRILAYGYKDYLFVITLLRDLTQQGAELARLYATRARPADVQAGYALIAKLQERVSADLGFFAGMFDQATFPPGDPTGVRTAFESVGLALAELGNVRAYLDGKANPLGLDPNFLVLVSESLVSGSGNPNEPFDSYDALMEYLWAEGIGPMDVASEAFANAKSSYLTYQAAADKVEQELSQISDDYAARYAEITGYNPTDPEFNGANPRPGSELAQSQ